MKKTLLFESFTFANIMHIQQMM